jgi:hypothetical protein
MVIRSNALLGSASHSRGSSAAELSSSVRGHPHQTANRSLVDKASGELDRPDCWTSRTESASAVVTQRDGAPMVLVCSAPDQHNTHRTSTEGKQTYAAELETPNTQPMHAADQP